MFSINKENDKPIIKDGKIIPRINVPPLADVAKEIKPLSLHLLNLDQLRFTIPTCSPRCTEAAPFPKDHWLQLSGEQMLAGFLKEQTI